MSPTLSIALPTATLRALLDFLAEQGSAIDPAGLADVAVRDWLQRQRELAKPAGQRGYLWKRLFLPEGTRLRISSHAATRYAAIVGDDLVHDGLTMSPNQFAQMTLGSARNAWDTIHVQFPGEREWKLALRLRHALEAQARRTTLRPVPAPQQMPAAAAPRMPTPQGAPRAVPDGALLAPRLRPAAQERRRSYRRAEDLLLD